MTRKKLLVYAYLGTILVCAGYLFQENQKELVDAFLQVDGLVLSFAFALTILAIIVKAYSWTRILKTLDRYGDALRPIMWLKAFLFGYLGRYLPGKVFMVLARTLTMSQRGYSYGAVIYAGLVENIVFVISAFILGLLFVLPKVGLAIIEASPELLPVLGAAMLLVVVTLSPLFDRSVQYIARLFIPGFDKRKVNYVLGLGQKTKYVFLACGYQILDGIAFSVLFFAVSGIGFSVALLPFLIGTFALAITIGMLALFAPAGIGVRELVIVLVLQPFSSTESAFVAALLMRFVMLAAELLLFALVLKAPNIQAVQIDKGALSENR